MKRLLRRLTIRFREQRGQTIVLVALSMVALLVFAGLAIDVGALYVGRIHLSRSVDAAALAGVVELPDADAAGSSCYSDPFETRTCYADDKAQDFLLANGINFTNFQSSREHGVIGSYRYRITVTHDVNLYFLPLVNFNSISVKDAALAEYNPWVDIYTDQSGSLGVLKTANQAFKGCDESTNRGDAFSPVPGSVGKPGCSSNNPWYDELQGKYAYRIYVPDEYPYDTVRVEILDPDDFDDLPFPSSVLISDTTTLQTRSVSCSGPTCLTGDPNNPIWFLGLDEDYQQVAHNPIRFTLFYYKLLPDGRLERQDIAQYTSVAGSDSQGTNMHWVSPGAAQAWDYGGSGVPNDAKGADWPGDGNFEIRIRGGDGQFGSAGSEVPDIYKAQRSGATGVYDAYIYMEAESQGDHAENAFELWAGPDLTVYPDVPSEVNWRNVYIIINGNEQAHGSAGAIFYAVGHLAFNSNAINRVEMQLTDIPPAWAGRKIRIDAFDIDTNTKPPFIFYFDTIPQQDWQVCYDDTSGGCNQSGTRCETTADGDCWNVSAHGKRCVDFGPADEPFQVAGRAYLASGSGCGSINDPGWHTYEFTLPPLDAFYGGRLKVSYGGGNTDNVTFRMQVESVPQLVE